MKRITLYITSVVLIFISGALTAFNWFVLGDRFSIEVIELLLFCLGLFLNLYHCKLESKEGKKK